MIRFQKRKALNYGWKEKKEQNLKNYIKRNLWTLPMNSAVNITCKKEKKKESKEKGGNTKDNVPEYSKLFD